MPQPLGPNQTKWIAALRSGDFIQGKGHLLTDEGTYCCLGVACMALGRGDYLDQHDDETEGLLLLETLPDSLVTEMGLFDDCGTSCKKTHFPDGSEKNLANLNDKAAWTFEDIANELEAHSELWFREPK